MHTKRNKGLRPAPDRHGRNFCGNSGRRVESKEAILVHDSSDYTLEDLKAYNDSFSVEVKSYVDNLMNISQNNVPAETQSPDPLSIRYGSNENNDRVVLAETSKTPLNPATARESDQLRLSDQFTSWQAPVKKPRWRDRIAQRLESRQSRNALAGIVVGTLALIGSVVISKSDSVSNFTIPEVPASTTHIDETTNNTDQHGIDYSIGTAMTEPGSISTSEDSRQLVHDSHHTDMGILAKSTLDGPQVSNSEVRIIAPELLPWDYTLALFHGDSTKVNDFIETALLIYNAENGTSYNYDLNGTGMFIDIDGHVMGASEVPKFNQLSAELFPSYTSA